MKRIATAAIVCGLLAGLATGCGRRDNALTAGRLGAVFSRLSEPPGYSASMTLLRTSHPSRMTNATG